MIQISKYDIIDNNNNDRRFGVSNTKLRTDDIYLSNFQIQYIDPGPDFNQSEYLLRRLLALEMKLLCPFPPSYTEIRTFDFILTSQPIWNLSIDHLVSRQDFPLSPLSCHPGRNQGIF